jgi:type I restriction enzyme S subunit
MNNISKDGFLDMTLVRRIPKEKASSAGKWLEPGDIIFNNTNSTELVGKSCIFTGWHEPCTFSNHLTRLRTNPKVLNREWLYVCLRELWLSGYFATNCVEFIGQSAFNKNKLKEVEIPIPPLAEQKRIVARIEELTRRVEEVRGLRREAVAEAEGYIPAAIAAIFADGRQKGWLTKKVKDICHSPQYGYTASAQHQAVGPKFLRITDIQNGKVDWDTVPYCSCPQVEKYRLGHEDILFARTGSVGKSFLVQDPPEAVFASYLIRLRVGPAILPEFLYWYFQSSLYWEGVFMGIEDGNRPNMNGSKLANLEIPFPVNLSEQRRIVEYLNGLRAKADDLKRLQAETEAELAAFTPALLAKAFRGEL